MSNDLLRRTWKAATGSSTNKLVLCFLADSANDKQGGKTNWYSMRGIADACELSIPTVKRAVRDLERQSHISVNSGKGRWKKNIYTVHPIATKTEDHEEAGDDEGEFNGITVIPLSDSTDSSSASNGITVSHEWYHGDPRMVSQGSTNGITVSHLNQDEPRETNSNQLTAPIESADASSHFALHEPVHVEPKTKRTNLSKGSLDEIMAFCKEIGLFPRDAEYLFHNWEGNGWRIKGKAIKNWQAAIRAWKAQGYLPSQKSPSPSDCWPSAQIQVEAEEEDVLAKMLRRKAEKEEEQRLAEGEPPEIVDGDSWDDEDTTPSQSPTPSKDSNNQTQPIANEVVHDEETLAILRRLGPPSAPPPAPSAPAIEEGEEYMTDDEYAEFRTRFEERIWAQYPRHKAKRELKGDFMRMIREQVKDDDLAAVAKGITRWRNSGEWTKDGGRCCPSPLNFLDDEKWKLRPPGMESSNLM